MTYFSKSEEKLFFRSSVAQEILGPTCAALKSAGYETSVIADIALYLQNLPAIPKRISIVNNRYLACDSGSVYDLQLCEQLKEPPAEPKRIALTFWLGDPHASQTQKQQVESRA